MTLFLIELRKMSDRLKPLKNFLSTLSTFANFFKSAKLPITIVIVWLFSLILFSATEVKAGPLADRVAKFPNWQTKPPVTSAKGDLIYPNWMAGTWQVTSTLVDMVAPLAPDIVTPGFEGNRRYLNQPISFLVRFQEATENAYKTQNDNSIFAKIALFNYVKNIRTSIVADREFNGSNIAKAVLGESSILSVRVNPENPNRQTTILPGNLELISLVTERGSEMLNPEEFIATEITQQIFNGESLVYLNEVETTTDYRHILPEDKIEADQITAIYLSPKDPNFFVAGDRPVSLYRYKLELVLNN
ncbi:MAG: hypothetical protein SXA11_06750 [Cyanobacteriota bacterium]|nr:hypothetical protein [Cyanobacteriota bacterium]